MKRESTISTERYKAAGVDIDAGNALVTRIGPEAAATARPGVVAGLGGFGAFFDPKAAGYIDPVLVAATDGVGTKLEIAQRAGRHDTIGIDLVAMCVNDLVVQGAEPLFFLDYFATGKLDVDAAHDVVRGVAEGCRRAGCALIGGETAEMPGLYPPGAYDLAGFAVGAVERGKALTGQDVATGDVIIGLASDGVHSNGYSLVRKIVADAGMDYDDAAPFAPEESLGAALLRPTRIYVKPLLDALRRGGVHALAHITGGGLLENLPRVLPGDLTARLDGNAWRIPDVFQWLAATGDVAVDEMARTFNCGIGMALIAAPGHAERICQKLSGAGESVAIIGSVEDGASAVILENWDAAWRA